MPARGGRSSTPARVPRRLRRGRQLLSVDAVEKMFGLPITSASSRSIGSIWEQGRRNDENFRWDRRIFDSRAECSNTRDLPPWRPARSTDIACGRAGERRPGRPSVRGFADSRTRPRPGSLLPQGPRGSNAIGTVVDRHPGTSCAPLDRRRQVAHAGRRALDCGVGRHRSSIDHPEAAHGSLSSPVVHHRDRIVVLDFRSPSDFALTYDRAPERLRAADRRAGGFSRLPNLLVPDQLLCRARHDDPGAELWRVRRLFREIDSGLDRIGKWGPACPRRAPLLRLLTTVADSGGRGARSVWVNLSRSSHHRRRSPRSSRDRG